MNPKESVDNVDGYIFIDGAPTSIRPEHVVVYGDGELLSHVLHVSLKHCTVECAVLDADNVVRHEKKMYRHLMWEIKDF